MERKRFSIEETHLYKIMSKPYEFKPTLTKLFEKEKNHLNKSYTNTN